MEVGYVQRVQALAILATVASLVAISTTYAMLTTLTAIQGNGSIKSVGIGVYWDLQCTNATSSLDFGLLEPGSQRNFSLYVQNEGNSALTLSMTTENWNPASATDYMTLTWDREGQQINANEVIGSVITLSVSEDVQGISSFSFDIILSGTG